MNNEYLTSKEVRDLFKIAPSTLYNWRKTNKINFIKINAKKVLYKKDDVEKLLKKEKHISRLNIIYCRVSSTKQKNDLITQKQILINYCNSKGIIIDKIFSEIASGMNENRKEFGSLIELILNNKVERIFITYKDRFSRFGFDYFKKICDHFNTEIVILENQINEENFQKELTEDLIAIIHHFSMKMYSNRRRQLKEMTKQLEDKTQNTSS